MSVSVAEESGSASRQSLAGEDAGTVLHQKDSPPRPWISAFPSTAPASLPSPASFTLGTGVSIYHDTLLPAIESASREVILATCFWAPSDSLSQLAASLRRLSAKSQARGDKHKIRVWICFSSASLLQKIFHTSSPRGHVYPPSAWSSKLGLPSPEELPTLEITVKSLFFRPFSVLHSKYLIIDRQKVWLPSCNVSWEEWFECCVSLEGPIVGEILDFWKSIWTSVDHSDVLDRIARPTKASVETPSEPSEGSRHELNFPHHQSISTTLLPHLHNSSLRLSLPLPFPFPLLFPSLHPVPPVTPLNTCLLNLFATATTSIFLLTPNVTSLPAYDAILAALGRSVDVRIITNRRMMVPEQLLTAGSVTEWWIAALIKAHKRLLGQRSKKGHPTEQRQPAGSPRLLEEGRIESLADSRRVGRLHIGYFRPVPSIVTSAGATLPPPAGAAAVKTHMKLTVIDGEVAVLGSGNMDRASWYTSQELGICLKGQNIASGICRAVEEGLGAQVEDVYDA